MNKKEVLPVEFTDANFDELALNTDQAVLVDFWAEWCGPCRMIGPRITEVATEYDGKAVIGKVNVDSNPHVATKYGIRSIPTILYLKNGEIIERSVGAVAKSVIIEKLEAAIAHEVEPVAQPEETKDATDESNQDDTPNQ